jgi:hypothetical protein
MKCSKCGAKALSEFCFKCKPRKPLSSGKGLNKNLGKGIYYQIRKKEKHVIWETSEKFLLLKEFFELCWKNKPHYSEVSGKFLGNKCSSLYQHHILAKSKYPEACFDEENIVFLTADEHASVELDMYKYEYINKKRELLKIKYNIL